MFRAHPARRRESCTSPNSFTNDSAEEIVRHAVGRAAQTCPPSPRERQADDLPAAKEVGASLPAERDTRIGDHRGDVRWSPWRTKNSPSSPDRSEGCGAASPASGESFYSVPPDEPAGRKSHPAVRRERRRMRTAVHPDRPVSFEGLVVPMDRHEAMRVRIAFFPSARIANRSHGVRRDVAVALMMAERHARGVVGQGEQPRRLVDRKPAIVAQFRTGAAFQGVFVQRCRPIAGDVEAWQRRVAARRRRLARALMDNRRRRRKEQLGLSNRTRPYLIAAVTASDSIRDVGCF